MKKLVFLFVTMFLLISFASAQISGFGDVRFGIMKGIEIVLDIFTPFFELIIGSYSTTAFFFAKILLLFLLIIICKYVLDKTPLGEQGGKISLLIAVIVSILAVRFISENELVEGILIPYGTLGIAITTIIPLVIFFYFVHSTNVRSFGRKLFWSIFIIILLVLWISKSSQIGQIANWIYILTLLAAGLFLIFDKSVHSYLGFSGLKKYEKEMNKKRIREIYKDLDELEEHFRRRRVPYSEYKREKKILQDHIKELSKE